MSGSSSAHGPTSSSPNTGNTAPTEQTTNSSSATRSKKPRSTRRGSPANTSSRLSTAGITKPFRPFHDLRHIALTHDAAAGNPLAYIQMRAGDSQASITEGYIHAAQVQSAGAAQRSGERLLGATGTSLADNSSSR
jgi:integrase